MAEPASFTITPKISGLLILRTDDSQELELGRVEYAPKVTVEFALPPNTEISYTNYGWKP
jgi:hypothetical protein